MPTPTDPIPLSTDTTATPERRTRHSDRTGSIEPYQRADGKTRYRARIWLADNTRTRVDVPEKHSGSTERRRLYAAAVQEREDDTGELLSKKLTRIAASKPQTPSPDGETCSKYRERLDKHRAELGLRGKKDDESIWRKWLADSLGAIPIAKVTRDDIERLRDNLDERIALHKKTAGTEGLSAKRALNVWSCITTTFKAAVNAKKRDLRVRSDNPCAGVLPPERGDSKRRTFIYPAELSALLACEEVPIEWREVYAVGSYLYLRPGELIALTWADIDFVAGIVHVTKSYDERTKQVKPPKTSNGIRDLPIPATLLPLLRRLAEGRPPTALVLPVLSRTTEDHRAIRIRRFLLRAGVDRPRLYENSSTTMWINFRSLRDSGITWLAMAGVDIVKVQRRAGHDEVSTTIGYVKQAEDLGGTMGEPFAALPPSLLLGTSDRSPERRAFQATVQAKLDRGIPKYANRKQKFAERAGFEPADPG